MNSQNKIKIHKFLAVTASCLTLSATGISIASDTGNPQKPKPYKHISDHGLKSSDIGASSKGFDGLYTGLSVGADFGKSRTSTSGSQNGGTFTANNTNDLSAKGASGGVFAGYGKTVKGIYLGAEISGDLYNSKGSESINFANGANDSATTTIKKTDSVSVTGRVGKQLGEKTLIYAKGGLTFPNYKVTSSVTNTNAGVTVANASASQTKRLTQPVAGAGIEHKLMEISSKIDLHLGGEYLHTFGKTTNLGLNSSTFNGVTQFDTSSDEIKARLIFKF